MQINGIAAIVTGGASGLGAATASRLATSGAKVTLFDLNDELGQAHAHAIGGTFLRVDVTSESQVEEAIRRTEAIHGKARILVNCAGIATPQKVLGRDGSAQPLAEFTRVITINLIGTFNVIKAFAAAAQSIEHEGEERAVIVNTASVAAFEGQIGQTAYAASKNGIVGMTLPLAREFARIGVRVVTIAPGLFMTPLLAGLPREVQESLGNQVPFPPRLGAPEEYALLVESIVLNPMLNGETIRLDGAIRMPPK